MIIEQLKTKLLEKERHDKDSFWASDVEKNAFDLYHRWIGTEETNPVEPETQIIFTSGKMIEEAIVEHILGTPVPAQTRVEMVREGVKITGYIDCIKDDYPIEIKTFYGDYQERELMAGQPKMSYLKQLAIYMDFMNAKDGRLLYFHRGTGRMYEFHLVKCEGDNTKYQLSNGSMMFDIGDEYRRFAQIYNNNVVPKVEPKSDFVYKYPIESVKWREIPKYKITKARTGSSVLGDWQVLYSSYKDLIVEREARNYGKSLNEYLGYSQAELERIKDLTAGYSKW